MYRKIDAHLHLSFEHLKGLLVTMDQNHIDYSVNLQRRGEGPAEKLIVETRRIAGDRIATFSRLYYDRMDEPGYMRALVERFEREVASGAKGLKVGKDLGLAAKYTNGDWVRVDDERLDPMWDTAARLGVPVLMHVADPIPAWKPLSPGDPLYDFYTKEHPDWYRGNGKYLPRLEILAQRERVLARHPKTIFVNAHWGCYPEDLDHLVRLFDTYPNFYADTEPAKIRIVPPGRVHTSHRDVLVKYADRTLYGTDISYPYGKPVDNAWDGDLYRRHCAWFETDADGGMALPDHVLRSIYYETAKRVYGF